jgi:ATP-dependent 26S proteasome regulatory subunit
VSGVFDVRWEGQDFVVAHAKWPEGYRQHECWYVVGGDRGAVETFTNAVCEFCNEPRHAVLAFRGGCWQRDSEIYKAIQAASFDDLVLAGDMAREIRGDFASFLTAKEEYARYGVPWKRGVLFLGPPGNGKTHCLRATIKMLDVPCLYVQSLKARYETDDANIARVFDRAREVTPCCLVFEDLDAMITAENRSTFLNQLDGFANASGMLTLATTNHPEQLDPAILERPSRFDRKYHFGLPAATERGRYIAQWRERLDPAMHIEDAKVDALVADTDGFSFAYLKELFLSAMMRWIKTRENGAMASVLTAQLQTLREQMKTDPAPTPPAKPPKERPFDF